jgi:Family of unknown function (DUF5763)
MASHAEANARAACKATTKAGKPCRKQAVADGLCTFHSGKLDLAELGRRGGQARGRKKEERAGDKLEGLAHVALEQLLTDAGGSATARAAAARLVLDKVAGSSTGAVELAKRALWAKQQAERAAELPAARAKLARLIDGRAQELAEAMTGEQIAELVERRAAEKAKELREEQKRLDSEAVEAELHVDAPDVASPGGQPSAAEALE